MRQMVKAVEAECGPIGSAKAACKRLGIPYRRYQHYAKEFGTRTGERKAEALRRIVDLVQRDIAHGLRSMADACRKHGITEVVYRYTCRKLGIPTLGEEVVVSPIKTLWKSGRKLSNPQAWLSSLAIIALLGNALHMAAADVSYGLATGMISRDLDPASVRPAPGINEPNGASPDACDVASALAFLQGEGGLLYCNLINAILGNDRLHPDWLLRRAVRDAMHPQWRDKDRIVCALRTDSALTHQSLTQAAHLAGESYSREFAKTRHTHAKRLPAMHC